MRFDAALVLYPAVIMIFLAFGGAMMLRDVYCRMIRPIGGP